MLMTADMRGKELVVSNTVAFVSGYELAIGKIVNMRSCKGNGVRYTQIDVKVGTKTFSLRGEDVVKLVV